MAIHGLGLRTQTSALRLRVLNVVLQSRFNARARMSNTSGLNDGTTKSLSGQLAPSMLNTVGRLKFLSPKSRVALELSRVFDIPLVCRNLSPAPGLNKIAVYGECFVIQKQKTSTR
jgi:hypothetical protein